MNEVNELKIDSTLWPKPAKLVNLLDFKPEKLSIKTENYKLSMIITHQVRYENGGFYLKIDNIKGYFSFSNNSMVLLNMIFSNDDQKNKYHQVWKEIFKLLIMEMENFIENFIIRSVYRDYYNRFYPQIHLVNGIYKKC